VIELIINGQPHPFETAPTVSQVLAALGLSQRRIAVERNGEIVSRSRFDDFKLSAGDRLEIVVAVGGG
jgi:sulfur carrier protein